MLKVVGASWVQTKIISTVLAALMALGIVVYIFGEYERAVEDGTYSATVHWSEDLGFRISFWGQGNTLEEVPEGIARAYYKPELDDNGWAVLEIESQADSPDWRQAYAAGFLEGSLCWQMIYWHWTNMVRDTCEGRENFCEQTRHFLEENTEWVKKTAEQLQQSDPFWHQVSLFYMQLEGLENGWRLGVERSLQELDIPSIDFLWLNVMSDLVDLEQKFGSSSERPNHVLELSSARGLSSAFIKLLPEARQMFVAHNTGGLYQSMLRVRKRYEFNYHMTSAPDAAVVPGQVISFTSYPGALHSQDDLYLVSGAGSQTKKHQLAVVGTAISNNNEASWDDVRPTKRVLVGPRAMAANRLATCGRTWARRLTQHNSGTGNKQWMVVDYGRLASRSAIVKKKKNPKKIQQHFELKGLLWVVEQLPELVHIADLSHQLEKQGYWSASGGVPFFEDISEASWGKQNEILLSYEKSPVAQIFSRDQSRATDLESVRLLMRSNNYTEDPLSSRDPLQAIAGRGDLSKEFPRPLGAIDTKVIVGWPGLRTQLHVTSGPAPVDVAGEDGGDSQDDDDDVADIKRTPQPFRWSSSLFSELYHIGHPDVWHFDSVPCKWVWVNKYEEML
ncbi:putative phospholipase B-like lamina ancestor [Anabrus simplex]|uniref:putative phospholipase B-like lamina ancestor n=1 Tax=Anabrus simplex TaxID=316456 RepID=UPI0035A35908